MTQGGQISVGHDVVFSQVVQFITLSYLVINVVDEKTGHVYNIRDVLAGGRDCGNIDMITHDYRAGVR